MVDDLADQLQLALALEQPSVRFHPHRSRRGHGRMLWAPESLRAVRGLVSAAGIVGAVTEPAARRIIVALDPSKRPLDPLQLGGQLARRLELPVALITVFVHHPLLSGPETEGQRQARAAAQADLLELGRTLEGVVVDDALVLASSSPARALHELSTDPSTALVVVGSTTRGAIRRVLPGNIAHELLSGAGCPVAIAPHGYEEQGTRPLSTVGVAFDGSDEAYAALAGARELARRAGAALHIITVVESLAFGAVPVSAIDPAGSASRLLEDELRAVHETAVGESRDIIVETQSILAPGEPADVLLQQSRQLDVLFAGSRAYGPLGAVLLGSTTRELMHGAGCPVVIVPRGRPG
jgi:nucleotide-binding universal stress UspA family protein